jgi:hypothetical protein
VPDCNFLLTSELSSPYPGTHPLLLRNDLREISQSFSPLELSILNHPYRIRQSTILISPPIAHATARNEMRIIRTGVSITRKVPRPLNKSMSFMRSRRNGKASHTAHRRRITELRLSRDDRICNVVINRLNAHQQTHPFPLPPDQIWDEPNAPPA